jgi:hypothetical protein
MLSNSTPLPIAHGLTTSRPARIAEAQMTRGQACRWLRSGMGPATSGLSRPLGHAMALPQVHIGGMIRRLMTVNGTV